MHNDDARFAFIILLNFVGKFTKTSLPNNDVDNRENALDRKLN